MSHYDDFDEVVEYREPWSRRLLAALRPRRLFRSLLHRR